MQSALENKTWRSRTVLERAESFPIDLPALRDPVHLRTQILARALKYDPPHHHPHSSTPHLKQTIVFSATLWSLLLHSLIFTTYSTSCLTLKVAWRGASIGSQMSVFVLFFLAPKGRTFSTLSIPDVVAKLRCHSPMSHHLTGDVRSRLSCGEPTLVDFSGGRHCEKQP